MAGSWSAGGSWLEFTPGAFAGNGAFTIAVLTNPSAANHGMAEWRASGVEQGLFLQYGWELYGKDDGSDGFGTYGPPSPGWMVWAITKAPGNSVYRFHSWPYAPDGSGVMTHGQSNNSGNHPDFATATELRVGHGAVDGQGLIAATAMWDRALSDAELDTLVSVNLTDWQALAPDFAVELSAWDGAAGPVVFAGTSAFVGETGTVDAGANPPGFDFGLGAPNQPPTVSAGPDQVTTTGDQVTLTASANDPDGTVDSYVWAQVSGSAVVLAGTGASRTFTPATAGVRVFSVQAFDNLGAASSADAVTVTTIDAVAPPSAFLLNEADLAYMRETQAGTRPTAAELFALLNSVPDGLGGHGSTYPAADDGQPISVRIWKVQDNTASGAIPQDLASRYAVADLRKIVTDLVTTKPGDLVHDTESGRWYEIVTHGEAEEWTTAQIVWATPTGKRPPA